MNFAKVLVHMSLIAILVVPAAAGAAVSASEKIVLERIRSAQRSLTENEKNIAAERRRLANSLNSLEQEVVALREKTAAIRRLSDEKVLSLTQLEERLEKWQQQQAYQKNLLHRFLQKSNRDTSSIATNNVAEQIDLVLAISKEYEPRFYPGWRESKVVLANGDISLVPTLGVGPITWFWDASKQRAGLASHHRSASGVYQSDLLLNGSDSGAVAESRASDSGELVFDPTLSRALVRAQNSDSVMQHILKGGIWVVPILLFALFALVIALFKVVQLWRLPKVVRFTPTVLKQLLAGREPFSAAKTSGMQGRLLALAQSDSSPQERDDQLFIELQDNKYSLEQWIGAIAITAAVSPLLGLLGTVSGMIETFKMMTLFGSGDAEVVSGGIAQALVTTELGLIVAIPALMLNAFLSRHAKNYYKDLENFAVLISKSDPSENTASIEATAS